jgi:ABC-type nitrate/sulfonate/bicarbonate transport system substrate-binding protein
VKLVYARPEDNLSAFLSGYLDAFSAGLTERIQARKHGGTELVIGPNITLPAIDGLVVRRDFAEQHPKEMQELIDFWFKTIQYMKTDVAGHSTDVRDYLRGKASVDYAADEYAIAWTFQHFPDSRMAAQSDFLTPGKVYYWKKIWTENSQDLIQQKKISAPVPESLFWGESTLAGR